jgi:hypothetical protein
MKSVANPSNDIIRTEPPAIYSVSKSLARGLVARMVAEWNENDKNFLANNKTPRKHGVIPKLPVRRALAYRVICERVRNLVPPEQLILETRRGLQNGRDKGAGFAIIHWFAQEKAERLDLLMTYVRPGWRLPLRWCFFELSTHALRRMFFRLNALEHERILDELKSAVITVGSWYPILTSLVSDTVALSIGIPTPNGVLFLAKKSEPLPPHTPAELVALTWISNKLMRHRPQQYAPVETARLEGGVVLQLGRNILPLTPKSNTDLLVERIRHYPDPYYQEMLKHLPSPIPLNGFLKSVDRQNAP